MALPGSAYRLGAARSSTLPRALASRSAPLLAAVSSSSAAAELAAELLATLHTAPRVEAPADVAADALEIVDELDSLDAAAGWATRLSGRWRLMYTSSRTFAQNRGLCGYAREVAGVETPELYMAVTAKSAGRLVTYDEPLSFEEGSLAALVGGFASADSVRVEAAYTEGRSDTMLIEANRIVVGERTWVPADRQAKAIRALAAARPVYLDERLFVLRAEPDYILHIFERA